MAHLFGVFPDTHLPLRNFSDILFPEYLISVSPLRRDEIEFLRCKTIMV